MSKTLTVVIKLNKKVLQRQLRKRLATELRELADMLETAEKPNSIWLSHNYPIDNGTLIAAYKEE